MSWSSKRDALITRYVRQVLTAISPTGGMATDTFWTAEVAVRILAQNITIGEFGTFERVRLIFGALQEIKRGGTSIDDPVAMFRECLQVRARERISQPLLPFTLIFPLHVHPDEAEPFRKFRSVGRWVRHQSWAELECRLDLTEWWKLVDSRLRVRGLGRDLLKTQFVPCVITAKARTAQEAWSLASPAFEFFRATLNLQYTWRRMIKKLNSIPHPLATFRASPLYAVFAQDRKRWVWYEHPTLCAYDQARRTPEWSELQGRLDQVTKLHFADIRQLLVNAVILYGRALDATDEADMFLTFWQVLELLSAKPRNEKGDVVGSIGALLGDDTYRDLLKALAETRNDLVHEGRYHNNSMLNEVGFMRSMVEVAFGRVFAWAPIVKNRESLRLLYECLPAQLTTLKERRRVIAAVLRSRPRTKSRRGNASA